MPMTSRVVTKDKKSDQPATIKKTNSAGNEESVETKVSSCIVKDKKIKQFDVQLYLISKYLMMMKFLFVFFQTR